MKRSCTYSTSILLQQLMYDINHMYVSLFMENLTPYRVAVIKQKLQKGLYLLCPLELREVNKKDLCQFLDEYRESYPDLLFERGRDSSHLKVVMPSDIEDELVLVSLSLTLSRLYCGSFPEEDKLSNLYSELESMGRTEILLRIDLDDSLTKIPPCLLLSKVLSLVGEGEGHISKLISSIFHLPIYNIEGENVKLRRFPRIGELSKVLLDYVFISLFDREFQFRYPGIPFLRFRHEVFIQIRSSEKDQFDEKAAFDLLDELHLVGKIVSLGPGSPPVMCYDKIIFLDHDLHINVCDPKEYF